MTTRGERRARTARIVAQRVRAAKALYWKAVPGKLKKRAPVCYCAICRMVRKSKRLVRLEDFVMP